MSSQVNYSDNIFYLRMRIKTLRDGMKLKVDVPVFINLFAHDIEFIDEKARLMNGWLVGRKFLLNRYDFIRQLSYLHREFGEMLQDILSNKFPIYRKLNILNIGYNRMAEWHLQSLANIKNELSVVENIVEQQVSSDELEYLLGNSDNK